MPNVLCAACSQPLPPGAPAGFCPRCAFGDAIDAGCLAGKTIGNYEILEEIGRGGMGTVYKARQLNLNRLVAIKVPGSGQLASAEEIRQFKAEAETVARFSHPAIVAIYEVGEHDGHPYFSMACIEGCDLAARIKSNPYSPREAAQLLIDLARAVHYAHQRGVLHRDLKPSNVLLDADSKPHLTDFGLARLFEGGAAARRSRVLAGSPAYMAPEQLLESSLLTVAVDVHGLGAVLYELLTGRPPFVADSHLETLRQVAEEAPKPLRQLAPKLDRDLETICLKCLAKEPVRRYGSAEALADELERWLNGDPILGRRATPFYRFNKFVRRHKAACAAAAAMVVALVLGTIISAWQATRAMRAERQATAEAAKSQWAVQFISNTLSSVKGMDVTQLKALLDNASSLVGTNATEEIEIKAGIRQALRDAYRGLEQAREEVPYLQKDLALREAALKSVQAQYGRGHSNTWNAMFAYGAKLKDAGRAKEALPLMEEVFRLRKASLGPDHPNTMDSMNGLAATLQDAGRLNEAIPLYEETLKLRQAKLGTEDSSVLTSMNNLGRAYDDVDRLDEAITLFRDAIRISTAKRGAEDSSTLTYKNNLALACQHAGRIDEALPLFEEVFAARKSRQGTAHPSTLSVMNNLASAYADAHRWGDAVALNEQVLNLRKAKLGPNHPETLVTMNNLAADYRKAGRIADAIRLDDEALKLRQTKLGDEHPLTLASMHNLASDYKMAGQPEKAMSLLTNALQLAKAKLGAGHRTTLTILNSIASSHDDARQLEQAIDAYEELLRQASVSMRTNHPSTLVFMNNLAVAYKNAGRHDEAVSLFEQTLRLRKASLNPNHPNILFSTRRLAEAYQDAGRPADADALWAEVANLQARTSSATNGSTSFAANNSPDILKAENAYDQAATLYQRGRFAEAEPHYRLALQCSRTATSASNELAIAYAASLARCLTECAWVERNNAMSATMDRPAKPLERAREAERLLRECLAVRQRGTNAHSWRVADVNSRLGFALAAIAVTDATLSHETRLAKLAEAEPRLLDSAAALQVARGAGTDYIKDALSRLVRLYEAWPKPDEAAEWRKRLESFNGPASKK